jgi:hypothetical protein
MGDSDCDYTLVRHEPEVFFLWPLMKQTFNIYFSHQDTMTDNYLF